MTALRQRAALVAATFVFAGSLGGFALATSGPPGGAPVPVAAGAGAEDERPGAVVAVRGDDCPQPRT